MIPGRLNNFDLIRLLAALQVIFIHSSVWLHLSVNPELSYALHLFPGVAIFFIISGFLVVKSYIDHEGNLKRYIFCRILRIYPALWVNLLIILSLLFITGAFNPRDIMAYSFLSRQVILFLIGNVCPDFLCGVSPFNWSGFYKLFPSGVLWTITVELGFYFIVPIIFCFINRQKFKLFYLISTLSILISFYFALLNTHFIHAHSDSFISQLVNGTIPAYLWIFLLGSFVYLKWDKFSPYLVDKFIYWFVFYVLLSIACFKIHHDAILDFKIISIFNIIRIFVLACCIISFAYSLKFLNSLTGKIDVSYGMYLYHMQIIFTLLFLGFSHAQYLWLIVYSTTFIIAILSWFLVEKPFLQLKTQTKIAAARLSLGIAND